MKAFLHKLRDLLALTGPAESTEGRSSYERFAIPYSFKPQLSFFEAVIAAGGAFLRIFTGSILFGFWGAYTISVWQGTQNPVWRGVIVVFMVLLFAVLLTLLMIAISAVARLLWPRTAPVAKTLPHN